MESPQAVTASVLRQLMARPSGQQVGVLGKNRAGQEDVLEGLALAGLIDLDVQRHRWRLSEALLRPGGLPVIELLCRLLEGTDLSSRQEAELASIGRSAGCLDETPAPAPALTPEGPPPSSGIVSLDVAARAVGVNRWTLNDWARQGHVPLYRDHRGHRRFDIDELREWLAGRSQPRARARRT